MHQMEHTPLSLLMKIQVVPLMRMDKVDYKRHDYYDLMGDIPEGTYTSIYSGSNHICALDVDNYVRCWGDAGYYGVTKPPNKRYQKLGLGQDYACALDFFGNIDCWGLQRRTAISKPPKVNL